jgi:hypothetical protein
MGIKDHLFRCSLYALTDAPCSSRDHLYSTDLHECIFGLWFVQESSLQIILNSLWSASIVTCPLLGTIKALFSGVPQKLAHSSLGLTLTKIKSHKPKSCLQEDLRLSQNLAALTTILSGSTIIKCPISIIPIDEAEERHPISYSYLFEGRTHKLTVMLPELKQSTCPPNCAMR